MTDRPLHIRKDFFAGIEFNVTVVPGRIYCKEPDCKELPTDDRGYCQKHVEERLQGDGGSGLADPDGNYGA